MNEVFQAAAELQSICEAHGWRFCFIGGVALQRWGEPRETADVDLSLFVDFGNEENFSDVLLNHFAYMFRRRPDSDEGFCGTQSGLG